MEMIIDNRTSMNMLLILLFFHVVNTEQIPPKIMKTIPIIFMMLTASRVPKCVRKNPITINPIVKIKWRDLKSLTADFLSSEFSFK